MKGGKIKLTDFGNVKLVDYTQRTFTTGVNYRYQPGENLLDTHLISTKTDIWSFGCIAYHLFTN